jgi:hypothetical protein
VRVVAGTGHESTFESVPFRAENIEKEPVKPEQSGNIRGNAALPIRSQNR